ncbi:MAG: hypothetical protein RIS76_2186 [Verrucomicrobiota bacterium]|jgi:Domain of Unknown Function (DUF1080)
MKPTLFTLRPGAIAPQLLAYLVLAGALLRGEPPLEEAGRFVPVFNGRDLAGWALQAHAFWRVENGALVGRQDPAEKEDGWLFSEAEWSDFTLELEFKVPERCNTGIALRMPREASGSPDVHGFEVQISDLPERKLTGSLLHHTESRTNNLHRANEWNRLAITCEQERIVIQLNGLTVLDVTEQGSRKGRIGMQVPKGQDFAGQEVRFRNLRVKEIPPKPADPTAEYQGRPWLGHPQTIPGPVFCAYYDTGGEGVAYHDTGAENQGSGKLNRADGSYLNEFRKLEGVDISYTKLQNDLESPCNQVTPPLGLLYVGWNEPGEWFKLTVETAKAGAYVADVLYTSQRGGTIGIGVDGTPAPSAFDLVSTFDAAETIPWRQWHHWNVARDAFEVALPKGVSVLTVKILTNGNLNLATFNFRTKGSPRTGPDITAVNIPVPVPAAAAFVWKSDCSSEAAFVGSSHPTIPGHYEYLTDPKEPARGLVFAGHLTPEFTTTDPEKFHLHPDIYFDRFLPGSITVSFDVKVDDLEPSELGPYGDNAWLNLVTLFDETTVAEGKSFHPSVMVNFVGTPGKYQMQAYSINAAGAGTFYEKIDGGPVFPTGKWVTVRLEVDVTTKQVRVFQDNALASAGPYKGKPGLAGAHMGLYANRKMTRATVLNDDITINVGD